MYIDSNYNEFTNLVELHDNYAILSDKTKIRGYSGDADTVSVVYNYYNPSFTVPATYTSEQSFNFIDYSDYLTNDFEDRGDFPIIFLCGFTLIFMLIFIINCLTKLVKRGGVFGMF